MSRYGVLFCLSLATSCDAEQSEVSGADISGGGPSSGATSGAFGSGGISGASGGSLLGAGGAASGTGGATIGGAMNGAGSTITAGGATGVGGTATGGSAAGGASVGGIGGASAGGSPNTGGSNGTNDAGVDDRCSVAQAAPGTTTHVLPMSGDLGTHDPTVIEENGVFYELQTGPGLPGKTSNDLAAWRRSSAAFPNGNPSWIASQVPAATDLWAPDLSFFGGVYHLYYSASTFGVNVSCIGHATRARMDSGSWSDHGSVVCSARSDDFNAIDPNVIVDTDGTPWLAFGSFWSGIKIVELNSDGSRADTTVRSIASRGGGAIEGAFIVRRCGYYYLFVSFDRCCAGAQSTYNVRVGRSPNVLGPYVDRSDVQMMNSGGTLVVAGGAGFAAAGHNAVIFSGTNAFNIYHAYPTDGSYARLRVADLVWDDQGWPTSAGP